MTYYLTKPHTSSPLDKDSVDSGDLVFYCAKYIDFILETPHLVVPRTCFCDLKPNAQFHNPTITTSGRKVTRAERKREEEEKRR